MGERSGEDATGEENVSLSSPSPIPSSSVPLGWMLFCLRGIKTDLHMSIYDIQRPVPNIMASMFCLAVICAVRGVLLTRARDVYPEI